MSITIKIPALWRPITHDNHVTVQAGTADEALRELVQRYPQLHSQLYDAREEVQASLNLFLNDEHLRYHGGLNAPLQDGDELYIVPLITGG